MNGEELKTFRKSLKVSQKEFADQLGVKVRTISSLESTEDIGVLYTNAVRFLMIRQKVDQLKELKAGSDELINLIQ